MDNTISVLTTQKLEFHIIQSLSTLPPDFAGKNKAAEIALHPTAHILYATNRGADDLIAFAIDPATGNLRELARTPTGGDVEATVDEIVAVNHLPTSALQPGQQLRIPQ